MDIDNLKFLKELFEEQQGMSADESPNDFRQWLQERRYDAQAINANNQGMHAYNPQGNVVLHAFPSSSVGQSSSSSSSSSSAAAAAAQASPTN